MIKQDISHRTQYPWWAVRFWNGMSASVWFGLLARHRFRISWTKFHIVFGASYFSLINSVLNRVQTIVFAGRIDCERQIAPIFIIGHWRSGTTYLHELLTQHPRFVSPSTYECFVPEHFLVSRHFGRTLSYLVPKTRPMDAMAVSWDSPQEDEFALLGMGLSSLYEATAFPADLDIALREFDAVPSDDEKQNRWAMKYRRFLGAVLHGRAAGPETRIVLKSPPHTARLQLLSDMFPKAQFIHLVRDPFEVVPSSIHLWRSLIETQSCQSTRDAPSRDQLISFVLAFFNRLYVGFFEAAAALPPERFVTVRYEDLIAAPLRELERVYSRLSLQGWLEAKPMIEMRLKQSQGWSPASYNVAPRDRELVRQACGWAFERFNYPPDGAPP